MSNLPKNFNHRHKLSFNNKCKILQELSILSKYQPCYVFSSLQSNVTKKKVSRIILWICALNVSVFLPLYLSFCWSKVTSPQDFKEWSRLKIFKSSEDPDNLSFAQLFFFYFDLGFDKNLKIVPGRNIKNGYFCRSACF